MQLFYQQHKHSLIFTSIWAEQIFFRKGHFHTTVLQFCLLWRFDFFLEGSWSDPRKPSLPSFPPIFSVNLWSTSHYHLDGSALDLQWRLLVYYSWVQLLSYPSIPVFLQHLVGDSPYPLAGKYSNSEQGKYTQQLYWSCGDIFSLTWKKWHTLWSTEILYVSYFFLV